MTKARKQTWGDDPARYAQEMNAWLDADDAAQEAAMWEQFDLAEHVHREETYQQYLGPREAIARAVSRLKDLPVRSPRAVSIRLFIEKIVGGRDDLHRYAMTLLNAKRGPGNKSRAPRQAPDPSVLEGDPWADMMRSPDTLAAYAKMAQTQEAEFIEHFAREAVDIYRRIKQRHRQLHFRRPPHGLPDDMELAVDRALRPPADAEIFSGDMTAAQRRSADKRKRDFRDTVVKKAHSLLHGDARGARRGRKRNKASGPTARKKRAPKASASGAH